MVTDRPRTKLILGAVAASLIAGPCVVAGPSKAPPAASQVPAARPFAPLPDKAPRGP